MARTKGDAKRYVTKRRRTTPRRKIVKRKRRIGSRRAGNRLVQFKTTNVVTTSFVVPEAYTITGTGGAMFDTLYATLADVNINPQALPYLELYNESRINAVRYTFRKQTLETTDNAIVGTMTYGPWKDNLPFTGTLLQMVRRKGIKQVRLEAAGGKDTCAFRPYVFQPFVYSGGLYAGMKYTRAPFLDNTNVTTTHTGMAFHIDNLPVGQKILVDLEVNASFRVRR